MFVKTYAITTLSSDNEISTEQFTGNPFQMNRRVQIVRRQGFVIQSVSKI